MDIQYLHGIHADANSSLENCLYYHTDARRVESYETFYKEKYTHSWDCNNIRTKQYNEMTLISVTFSRTLLKWIYN